MIPLIYKTFTLIQKTMLALNISYTLLNLKLFQTCSQSFTDFQDCILENCNCNKRMQNISTRYNITGSFDQ